MYALACARASSRAAKYDAVYLPRGLVMTNRRLALVGDIGTRSAFANHLVAYYPGLSKDALAPLNCTGLTAEVDLNGALDYFPPFTVDMLLNFDTEAELESYTQENGYGMNVDSPAVYMAVVFTSPSSGGDWRYSIRANASDIFDTHTVTNSYQRGVAQNTIQNYMYTQPFSQDAAHPLPYYMPGFIPLQTAVDKFIINATNPG
ncbi:hypothetical protein EON67_11730, partial [archaeon]